MSRRSSGGRLADGGRRRRKPALVHPPERPPARIPGHPRLTIDSGVGRRREVGKGGGWAGAAAAGSWGPACGCWGPAGGCTASPGACIVQSTRRGRPGARLGGQGSGLGGLAATRDARRIVGALGLCQCVVQGVGVAGGGEREEWGGQRRRHAFGPHDSVAQRGRPCTAADPSARRSCSTQLCALPAETQPPTSGPCAPCLPLHGPAAQPTAAPAAPPAGGSASHQFVAR